MTDSEKRLRLAKMLWGWEPHETQREWLLCEARAKVAACGRRWGKTEAAAVDATTMALMFPGSVQMIVSPSYDQSKLIFGTVEKLMLDCPLTRAMTNIVRTPYPRLMFGRSVIMARTADEDGRNLRGHSADRVIVDEAAYVRDSVVTEVISPMLADRNGRLVMISTPFGKNHFYRSFVKGQVRSAASTGRIASFTFPSWSNPHISTEYIEQQREELTARQFAVEYEAQFVDEQSCVFPWADIQAAVELGLHAQFVSAEGFPDTTASEATCVVAGIDWARYSDYTALVALGVSEAGCEVIAVERFNNIAWDLQIQRVIEFLKEHRVCAALADQTSIGDPLLDQLRSKLWETGADVAVEGYAFTNQSKRAVIENLALRFSHRRMAIPRDEDLIRELQYFEYELTQAGNVRMNARSGHHDDMVIALALAAWQARNAAAVGPLLTGRPRVAAGEW